MKRVSWAVSLALLVGAANPAFADSDDEAKNTAGWVDGRVIQSGRGIEVGAIYSGGRSEFASNELGLSPSVQGLILRDRNGTTTRMVFGLIVAVAGALAQSGPKSVERSSYRSGDYIVTTTKTTYYSEAEKAQMAAATSSAIDGIFSTKYSDFEGEFYSRDRFERGDASGYKLNFLVGDGGDSWGFETGFGFGNVKSYVERGGAETRIDYKYVGMPFRLSYAPGPFRVALTWEWNWAKYGVEPEERQLNMETDMATGDVTNFTRTASHPWKLDVETLLLKRIAVRAGVSTQVLKEYRLGYTLSAGLYF